MRACPIAGKLGSGGSPARLFPPFGLFEAERLEGGEGDHGHQLVSAQAFP